MTLNLDGDLRVLAEPGRLPAQHFLGLRRQGRRVDNKVDAVADIHHEIAFRARNGGLGARLGRGVVLVAPRNDAQPQQQNDDPKAGNLTQHLSHSSKFERYAVGRQPTQPRDSTPKLPNPPSGSTGTRFALRDHALTSPTYLSKGDHAGSEAKPGVDTGRSLYPVTSTLKSFGPPCSPGLSRKNMRTRPFGAQVGPSLWNPSVSILSPEPSGFITPMANRPPFILVKATWSPRGDQTGVEYRPSP